MTCEEFRALIPDPPASGELATAFDRHAFECPACREAVAVDRLLTDRERALLVEKAPPKVVAGVFEEIGRICANRRLRWRLFAAAAFVILVVSGRALVVENRHPLEQSLIHDYLEYAANPNPAEYATADAEILSRWFAGHLPFAVEVPKLRDAQLLGGRRCRLREFSAALALYETGGRRISLFVLPPEAGFGELPCRRTERGVNVIVIERRGLKYAFVGDVPAERLQRWAGDVLRSKTAE